MTRWTIARKLAVLDSIKNGVITADEAMSLHEISKEELDEWTSMTGEFGPKALRVTHLQKYRRTA